jgi:GTP-binding protein
VLFCSQPSAFTKPYQRFLMGKFRDELPFPEVPIKLYLRKREQTDERDEVNADDDAEDQALIDTSVEGEPLASDPLAHAEGVAPENVSASVLDDPDDDSPGVLH